MRIAVISDVGSEGGAAIAATRLCVGLRRRGHHVARLFGKGSDPSPESADATYPLALDSDWPERIWTVFKAELSRSWLQSKWVPVFRTALEDARPDAINVHNLHNRGWDLEIVRECLRHAPVVWTMHDMWPITGSCAYAYDCRKFESQCDSACPQLGIYPTLPPGLIARAHRRRNEFYSSKPKLIHVTPSRWLAREASQMTRESVPARAISNGLDLEVFRPMPAAKARELLHLPDDVKPTILASAASLSDRRKGMPLLLAAIEMIPPQPLRLLLVGGGPRLSAPGHVELAHLGSISGDPFLNLAYNAADFLCHPALMDNQPLVVMEAMACGKPAVALPVGGVPEMVKDGTTGWLAKAANEKSLADALGRALAARAEWPLHADRCRLEAEREYCVDLQSMRYERVFESLGRDEPVAQEALDQLSSNQEEAATNAVERVSK